MKSFNYTRRKTTDVTIGRVKIGSEYPIEVQSMTSTSTMDTAGSVAQSIRICQAGGRLVRLTAQGVKEAENIGVIRSELRAQGYNVPLVADIHFNPRAAFAAVPNVEKVRINPGNFVDPGRVFKELEYTAEEYKQELQRIEDSFVPFLELCKEHKTAIRIGVNHGSLSDRIMSHYGDTPAGMVESAMEYLRICVKVDFKDVVISIKASNTVVMVETVRRLVVAMEQEGLAFPLHLGVTEAGDGEDGRIKSAVGIGTLLTEGVGDTIRVSLSEEPELEIPVAETLVNYINTRTNHPEIKGVVSTKYNPIVIERRNSGKVANIGASQSPIVIANCSPSEIVGELKPDYYLYDGKIMDDKGSEYPIFSADELDKLADCSYPIKWLKVDTNCITKTGELLEVLRKNSDIVILLSSSHINIPASQQAFIHTLLDAEISTPIILCNNYEDSENEPLQVKAAADLGTVLMNGFGDGVLLSAPNFNNATDLVKYQFAILQASRLRISKTEYISCPGCGRTLFNLQKTISEVKAATSHLKHLKIGIMGCIVNGPGEMADADYGYVGAAPNKISLYKGKRCIERNITETEAIEKLITLIKANNDWSENLHS
ncbi:MAG: (E)-4-hydroxy-3-methylbut-2-enyl-diphosphate synthase [Bacteroidales bacterium]